MNKYHRYINLPFEISRPPILDNLPSDFFIGDDGWRCPKMEEFLSGLGLEIGAVEYLQTPENGGRLPPHSDQQYFDNHVKINISYGPEDAKMVWWEVPIEKTQPVEEYDILFAHLSDCTRLWEATTNQPSLCNVGVVHSTENPSKEKRFTLCFIPSLDGKHIQWEDALQIFGEYIDE